MKCSKSPQHLTHCAAMVTCNVCAALRAVLPVICVGGPPYNHALCCHCILYMKRQKAWHSHLKQLAGCASTMRSYKAYLKVSTCMCGSGSKCTRATQVNPRHSTLAGQPKLAKGTKPGVGSKMKGMGGKVSEGDLGLCRFP